MDEDLDIEPYLISRGYDGAELQSRWRSVKCLFHDDKHASARANKTGYACLACGVKGDAITLIKKVENVDFDRALEIYKECAERSGYSVPQSASRKRRGRISPLGEAGYERGTGLFPARVRRITDEGR